MASLDVRRVIYGLTLKNPPASLTQFIKAQNAARAKQNVVQIQVQAPSPRSSPRSAPRPSPTPSPTFLFPSEVETVQLIQPAPVLPSIAPVSEPTASSSLFIDSPDLPPVNKDVAFVFFLSWMRENGVTFAHLDMAMEPTFSTADLHPVVAKHVLFIKSAPFQSELQKFKALMTASYPAEEENTECPKQLDPVSALTKRAKLPPPDSQQDYFKDPQLTLNASKLANWGARLTWPLNELLQWGQTQLEDQAACNLTDEFLNSVLQKTIAFAAKNPYARSPCDAKELYLQCRVPTMQVLLTFFGFRVYPIEPRLTTFARLIEYMCPLADIQEGSCVMDDEDWTVIAEQLNAETSSATFSKETPGNTASAWVRLQKMKACRKTASEAVCPKGDDVFGSLRKIPAKEKKAIPGEQAAGAEEEGDEPPLLDEPSPAELEAEESKRAEEEAAEPQSAKKQIPSQSSQSSQSSSEPGAKFKKFVFKGSNVARYKLHPRQEALDEALDKGMIIPLKLGKVPEVLMRNFAAAFMLGGRFVAKEPANAVKTRCVKFLERFVFSHVFLETWAMVKGYRPDQSATDAILYRTYVLHQACEQAGVGDACELTKIFKGAQETTNLTPATQPKAPQTGLLLQIPNTSSWMRIESGGADHIFLVKQCVGHPQKPPSLSEFKLVSTLSNTTLEDVLSLMKSNRYVIRI